MSRIHEALQQAEQEILAGIKATAVADKTPSAEAVSRAPETRGSDEFLETCQKPKWMPDPKTMLFFGSAPVIGGEQFRTLRSQLCLLRSQRTLKKLSVTSTLPGEGKTFVAANLAQAIAQQQGTRVLLIDADLRRPQLHIALGTPSQPGLSDYLAGTADEAAVIQRGPLEGLFFIAGGSHTSNPAEMIAGSRLPQLLDKMAPHFDWIIVDCPPALPVADPVIISGFCDGVLMVVQAESTPHDLAAKVKAQLKDKWIVGAVLNRVKATSGYGSYYYYGNYGQDSGKKKR